MSRPIGIAATSTQALQRAAQAHEDTALSVHLDEDDEFERFDSNLGDARVTVLYWVSNPNNGACVLQGCEISDGTYIDKSLLSNSVQGAWEREAERNEARKRG